jgi:hypothetical protein
VEPLYLPKIFMPRKKKEQITDITPALLKFREKRKWQINLRRYVLHKHACPDYAPYFGMDIKNMRQWFEYQFQNGETWENFGRFWQFDHIIPVTYFNFSDKEELKLCWNFTNIRVEHFQKNKDRGNRLYVLAAKNFFIELYETTKYPICYKLLQKIDQIEISELVSTRSQQNFIKEHQDYLKMIEGYSHFEFELLNSGRSIEEVKKEIEFVNKLK